MNSLEALKDINGLICSGCNSAKRPRNSFCLRCYLALPSQMQKALWNSVSKGYVEAFMAAQKWLHGQQVKKLAAPEEEEMLWGKKTNG